MTDAKVIVKYIQKPHFFKKFSVMTAEQGIGKTAKTRENERLSLAKLKKSKIFQKVLDKVKGVWYNNRRENQAPCLCDVPIGSAAGVEKTT